MERKLQHVPSRGTDPRFGHAKGEHEKNDVRMIGEIIHEPQINYVSQFGYILSETSCRSSLEALSAMQASTHATNHTKVNVQHF